MMSMEKEVDSTKVENRWQSRWEKHKLFEADPDKKKPKYFITVPYPYASGPLHIGHGRTYTVTDIFTRFKRMQGFNVLWPMAFHITGTPVISISDRIKEGDKPTIDLYKGYVSLYVNSKRDVDKIVKSFENP